jgi:hypothetical protein
MPPSKTTVVSNLLVVLASIPSAEWSADLHVAPNGIDSNPGTSATENTAWQEFSVK